jgi:hypothetical protein
MHTSNLAIERLLMAENTPPMRLGNIQYTVAQTPNVRYLPDLKTPWLRRNVL